MQRQKAINSEGASEEPTSKIASTVIVSFASESICANVDVAAIHCKEVNVFFGNRLSSGGKCGNNRCWRCLPVLE
jgi:hypothetical protein